MDLMTLNATNQASKLIENYDSLIWTERFNTVGDFQITTGNVDGFLNLLPEQTRLTLRESNVAMVVETHQIVREKNKPQKLVIKGRSFESILDRRVAVNTLSPLINNTSWKINAKTSSDVAWYIMDQICRVGSIDSNDIFPAAMVVFPAPADYTTSTGPTKAFEVPRGKLLQVVLDLLQVESQADATTTPATPVVVPHGIRAIRPSAAATAIGIQIYLGVDRSANVYFDATRDLLDDGTYLFSKVGSANVCYGIGNGMSASINKGAVTPSGLERRVTMVDATGASVNDAAVLKQQMIQSLTEARETAMFDGSINQDISPYKYGVDYNLGDIVRVVGDYGLDQKARVTEYIRSEDATGVKSYPTLTAITT